MKLGRGVEEKVEQKTFPELGVEDKVVEKVRAGMPLGR